VDTHAGVPPKFTRYDKKLPPHRLHMKADRIVRLVLVIVAFVIAVPLTWLAMDSWR
jgi:hypothetical protein